MAKSRRGCRVGLRRRSRKAVLPKGDVGSNPTLSATNHVGFVAAVHLTWCAAPYVMYHALNHVRFRIRPELNVVQSASVKYSNILNQG